jgi:RND superfamily putative drug exporter
VVKALSATGGVLTSAGIILAGTFLILLSQPVKDLAEISIGVALGVLIDTFLVRTALVPGLTLWIGPKAGWPGPLWSKQGAADEAPPAQADEPRPLAAGDKPVGDEA